MLYFVSFNNSQYELGGYDEDGDTIDYHGEDLEKLVAYVEKADPDYPMTFIADTNNHDENLVGFFYNDPDDEDCKDAVLYKGRRSDLSTEVK